jgi:hypothetical protein
MDRALQPKLDECLNLLARYWAEADACERLMERAHAAGDEQLHAEAVELFDRVIAERASFVGELEDLGLDPEGARR